MKKNAGFTLIELVAVMVILAILAVVAVPQFVDLRTDAREAAVEGVAGAISSAAALNFAVEMANASGSAVDVDDCADGFSLLQAVPAGFTAAQLSGGAVAAGETKTNCVVAHPDDAAVTANFTLIGVDN